MCAFDFVRLFFFPPSPTDCVAMWLFLSSVHVCVRACVRARAEMCACIQCTSCLPLALSLVPPFGLPAINPFIPSKTSKLPSSGAREGAALCLMSLLFCCSDLPLPKPRSSTVTR